MTYKSPNHNPQSGSVFIYILLAIALLAALSYAVSRGNRGGTSALTEQQAKLAAQEIIDYGNTVAAAVQKLRLRGCSDTEISFENNVVSAYTNPNAPSDKSCHVFDNNGGNIQYTKSPLPYYFPSNPAWRQSYGFMQGLEWNGFGTTCGSNSCGDLVIILQPITEQLCTELNKLSGITSALENSLISGAAFQGSYTYQSTIGIESSSTAISNKNFGCVKATNTGLYSFLQILLSR